jgi:invasion protein IalB
MKNLHRCSATFLFMLVAIASFASVPHSGIAQTTEVATPKWNVNCNNNADPTRLDCTMSQIILQNGTGQRIIASSVFTNGDTYTMVLSLPHGIDLTSGVNVSIDQGAAQKFQIQTADANGAYSRFTLTPALISAMRSGNILIINIVGAAKNAVRMEMSLAGFLSSFDLISQ